MPFASRHAIHNEGGKAGPAYGDAAAPHTPLGPAQGDVLISAFMTPRVTWTLRALPGPAQVACASLRDATKFARGYAAHAHVDVWEHGSDGHATRLFHFRAGRSNPAAGTTAAHGLPGPVSHADGAAAHPAT